MSENRTKAALGGLYRDHHAHNPGNPAAMQMPATVDEVHGGGGSAGGLLVGDSQALVRADAQIAQSYGAEQDDGVIPNGGGEGMEEDQDGPVEREGMEDEMPPDASNLGMIPAPGMGNQLTLSFQGEVYVFDSVSPEKMNVSAWLWHEKMLNTGMLKWGPSDATKVQAVLLLLGGRELTSGVSSLPSSSHQNNKRSNFPQRVASLMRFREKRKERNFDKKIRYTVRKEVALRMQRHKGQFTSSKSKPEDAALGVTSWDATQHWGAVDNLPQGAASCHHCGTSAKSTPMMRRGPDGPRTLCNACGLMWANKGTLRDLSKNISTPMQNMQNTTSTPKVGMAETTEVIGQQGLPVDGS